MELEPTDQERAYRYRTILYGLCEHCGAPRDVKRFMVGVTVYIALWCPSCGQEPE